MDDQKVRRRKETKNAVARAIREGISTTEEEMLFKLEVLDAIFGQSENPEEFHRLYVKPLLEQDVKLEIALDLLVSGVVRPN
jgi:hypothetical protein